MQKNLKRAKLLNTGFVYMLAIFIKGAKRQLPIQVVLPLTSLATNPYGPLLNIASNRKNT